MTTNMSGDVDSSAALTSTLGLAWYPDLMADSGLLSLETNVCLCDYRTRSKADSGQAPSGSVDGFDDDLTDLWQIFGS